jgi:hypothetical protein
MPDTVDDVAVASRAMAEREAGDATAMKKTVDKRVVDVAAEEKATADAATMEGATTEVASWCVLESSPTPTMGAKRTAISGSSTPPTKHQFCGSWKPRYVIEHCICPSFLYAYFVSLGFFIVQCVSLQLATINKLDTASQKVLSDTKDLYASAEARANTTIEQEQELVVCIHAVVEREQVVEELEQRLQDREGLDIIKLGHELEALATRESSLDSREATLEVGQKTLEVARLMVIACEFATDVREIDLDTMAVELVEREKQLAERQMQELAAAEKRSEELQASRAGEGRRVWDILGQTKATLVPLGFSPLHFGLLAQEVDDVLPLLNSAGAKMS